MSVAFKNTPMLKTESENTIRYFENESENTTTVVQFMLCINQHKLSVITLPFHASTCS